MPKLQFLKLYYESCTRHTLWSCLTRCANMKWIWLELWKIWSGHDSIHRWTDGQTEGWTRWSQYTPLSTSLKRGYNQPHFDTICTEQVLLKHWGIYSDAGLIECKWHAIIYTPMTQFSDTHESCYEEFLLLINFIISLLQEQISQTICTNEINQDIHNFLKES